MQNAIECFESYLCYVCEYVYSSQSMTKRTSKASAWSSPQPVRTSWNVAWTMSALWRWSVARKSYRGKVTDSQTHISKRVHVVVVLCQFSVHMCLFKQLGGLWTLQLLWAAVHLGKRRLPSLGVLERQQCLPHWEANIFPANLLCCESETMSADQWWNDLPWFIFDSITLLWSAQNHKESEIAVFERENFIGHQWEITDDYPSLKAMGWLSNEIGSMQAQSGAWVPYFSLSLSLSL